MSELFIHSLLEGDFTQLKMAIVCVVAMYGIMVLAMVLDLFAGIRKAKKSQEFISSFALRRTINKAVKYLNLALIFTLVDFIVTLLDIYSLPYATAFCAVIVCVIEIKSVFEKYEEKEKAKVKDAARTLKYIAENRADILELFGDLNQIKNVSKTTSNHEKTKGIDHRSDGGSYRAARNRRSGTKGRKQASDFESMDADAERGVFPE